MTQEEQQLLRRLEELAARAAGRGCYTASDFLNLAQQTLLLQRPWQAPFRLEGGYPDAERRIAWFGDEALCGYAAEPPICCLEIAPKAAKFAEPLTHRDFLGALMHMGVRREVMGDIVLHEQRGFLFCQSAMADYFQQLEQVRHTAVTVRPVDEPPAFLLESPPVEQIVVASERADALLAAVYRLSRAAAQDLFIQGKVFCNSCQLLRADRPLQPGDLISVRGYGRFRFGGVVRETRKGRLRAEVAVFR